MMDGSHGISADRSMHVFILDSGSPVHCTGDRSLLSDYCHQVPFHYLRGASGTVMRVHGIGSIHNENFQVKGVFYIPEMNNLGNTSTTIFSVSKLNELCLSVCFNPDGTSSVIDCKQTWNLKREIVGEAREDHGHFMLDYLRIPPNRDPVLLEERALLKTSSNASPSVWSSMTGCLSQRATCTQRPLDVSGRDAAVAERLDAAVEGEQAVLATEVVQPEVAEVSARSYKGSGTKSSNGAVQLEAGESSRRTVAAVVKERTADGVKGKGDVVKVDQLREERTKAVVVEAPRETTAAVVQAVAESPSQCTDYLISSLPNRRLKRTITSWIKGQHVGSGSFGSVYEAISKFGSSYFMIIIIFALLCFCLHHN